MQTTTVTTIDGKQVNVTVQPDGGNASNMPPMNPPPYQSYQQQSYPHPPGPGGNVYQPPMGYPPQQNIQQPGYPNIGFQQTTVQPGTVIVTNPVVVKPGRTVVVGQALGPDKTMVRCPQCNQNVVTRVDREISMMTHCWALTLCLIGCWPCVWVPYCTPACQNSNHYCSHCGNYVGSYGMC